ncbi:MAG: 30S ribosomal protein S9 [Parcubacteria group bacterium]|nr:30S ribosomal protein S9 [Parcubacteria group bacterium]
MVTTEQQNTEVASIPKLPKGRYIETVGRRKTATARVRIFEGVGAKRVFSVNNKDAVAYFQTEEMQQIINEAFQKVKVVGKFDVSAHVSGGGIHAQAEALRHGLSRALVEYDSEWRGKLKKSKFLSRDQREKERRKFGLKKARKAPQWSKR